MQLKQVSERIPAPLLFVTSGAVQYTGAAFAVVLFATASPASVAWWRVTVGALVLLAMWRPWRLQWTRRELLASAVFGLVLASMNIFFYEAIHRLPLGVAVSIEFLGPVSVAVWRGKGVTTRVAAFLALLGVFAIGGWGIDLRSPEVRVGTIFILGAAVMWAIYIVMGQRIASQRSGVASLTVGMTVASIVYAPLLAPAALRIDFTMPTVLTILGVAVFSTAIPYSLEAVALKRLTPQVFALLTSLLPTTSTVVGAVMLAQMPAPAELIGLVLVSIAVWLASRVE